MAEPDKIFTIPFADGGTRNEIPETTSELGRASLSTGFPPETSLLPSQGGKAPSRADFNGIFYDVTRYLQWVQAGGQWTYSAALDYAQPAIVNYGGVFYSCVDDNGPNTSAGVQAPGNAAYWELLVNAEPDLTEVYEAINANTEAIGTNTDNISANTSAIALKADQTALDDLTTIVSSITPVTPTRLSLSGYLGANVTSSTGGAYYWKNAEGLVTVSFGLVYSGTATDAITLATLPSGFRPYTYTYFPAIFAPSSTTVDFQGIRISISSAGAITISNRTGIVPYFTTGCYSFVAAN